MDNQTQKLLHDLRNPLNSISVNAELGKVLSGKEDVNTSRLIELYGVIVEECRKCSSVLDSLSSHLKSNNAQH